jgi:hypothetical protein
VKQRVGDGDLLLGFDARVTAPDTAWNERRRRGFLFRLDVVRPLSIDPEVWPSAFDRFGVPRPAWVGIFAPLWESLADLRQAVDTGIPPGSFGLAAFARMTEVCTPDERKALETQLRGIHPDGTPGELPETISVPAAVEPGWTFLGYDVSDLGGLSGLMNCGFVPEVEDVDALRARWGPKLNDWHLFDDLADARGFKDFSNQRVAEHAPFYVDGIWQVEG